MKNFKKTSLLFLVMCMVVGVVGCNDQLLETSPKGEISESEFWQSEEDARNAANALYNFLDGANSPREIYPWFAISDIGHANAGFMDEAQFEMGTQNSNTSMVEDRWASYYRGIRSVNEYLANVQRVDTDEQIINRLRGEARFIRAYLYTYLVMVYGDIPFITQNITIDEARDLVRTDKEEVWDFISSEFTDIAEILPESYENSQKGRITKGAALAMKARAMVYAGRYEEAYNAADEIMALGVYSLYPSYENLFSYDTEQNSEVILDKAYVRTLKSHDIFDILAPFSQNSALTRYVPTKKIVDAYEMENGMAIDQPNSGFDPYNPYKNRDPRLSYTIFTYGDTLPNGEIYDPRPGFGGTDDVTRGNYTTTSTGFNIKKYITNADLDQPENSGLNIILIRYAEVLLTYAEGKIESGNIDQSVYDAINSVRQRSDVDMPQISSPKTQEEMRDIIRHERLVELAFEGHRYFDIRRWGIAEDVMNGPIKGMRYENGELKTVVFGQYQRNFDPPKDYLWPIPEKELTLNSNLNQNPGY